MKNLDKQSTGNEYFDRALKKGKVREADRTGYIRAWNRAGTIIKANRRKPETGVRKPSKDEQQGRAGTDT